MKKKHLYIPKMKFLDVSQEGMRDMCIMKVNNVRRNQRHTTFMDITEMATAHPQAEDLK